MKKIFIDVGSYTGDTLVLALKNSYDIIHCFEPVQKHYQKLTAQVAAAGVSTWVIIHPYGLYSHKMEMDVFAAGSDGASIFQEKKQFQYQNIVEKCYFRRAAEFFRKFIVGDLHEEVHMKINAEGAEITILNDLIVNHQLNKVSDLCVHYDCLKIPGHEKEAGEMEFFLNKTYANDRLMVGRNKLIHSSYKEDFSKNKAWVENWLRYINTKHFRGDI